jgi:hypothetical protein
MKEVKIKVKGGKAYVVSAPDDVLVVIIDYDDIAEQSQQK